MLKMIWHIISYCSKFILDLKINLRLLLPLIHFDMRGLAAQTAATHHIHTELRRTAIFAWRAFRAVFFAVSYFHEDILFIHTKNKLWSFKKQLYKDLH